MTLTSTRGPRPGARGTQEPTPVVLAGHMFQRLVKLPATNPQDTENLAGYLGLFGASLCLPHLDGGLEDLRRCRARAA
jgi:hypothetical protein